MEPINLTTSQSNILNDQIVDIRKRTTLNLSKDEKAMKTAQEFEGLFISKMMEMMDSTISKEENGLFSPGKNEKTFKSFFFQEIGKEISKNPATSIGVAKQIYEQIKDMV